MPARSQAQRAYLNARFGHEWVKRHHFDNKGKLPEHVEKTIPGWANYRPADVGAVACATCDWIRDGHCTMFENTPVESDHVCDAWEGSVDKNDFAPLYTAPPPNAPPDTPEGLRDLLGALEPDPDPWLRKDEGLLVRSIPSDARAELRRFWDQFPELRQRCKDEYGHDPVTDALAYWQEGAAEPEHKQIADELRRNGGQLTLPLVDRWEQQELRHTLQKADIKAAGIAVRAADSGRVLMLQRSVNPGDPAAGCWEFPGGCLNDGEHPYIGARREWQEEIGRRLPRGKHVGSWRSGIYQGFVHEVPSEFEVEPNVHDPDGDQAQTAAWWDPQHLKRSRAVRQELHDSRAWDKVTKSGGALYLISHAKTRYNRPGQPHDIVHGWKNTPLDDTGRKQARKLGEFLKGADMELLHSSDLKRAAQTAHVIGKVAGVRVAESSDYRPWNLGDFAGHSSKDVIPKLKPYMDEKAGEAVDGGESFNAFKDRFLPALEKLLDQCQQGKTVGLVTHSRNIELVQGWLGGKGPRKQIDTKAITIDKLDPAVVFKVTHDKGWKLKQMADETVKKGQAHPATLHLRINGVLNHPSGRVYRMVTRDGHYIGRTNPTKVRARKGDVLKIQAADFMQEVDGDFRWSNPNVMSAYSDSPHSWRELQALAGGTIDKDFAAGPAGDAPPAGDSPMGASQMPSAGTLAAVGPTMQEVHVNRPLKNISVGYMNKKIKLKVMKAQPEQQLVYGVVLEPNVIDSQDDFMLPDHVEKAAHTYMKKAMRGRAAVSKLQHRTPAFFKNKQSVVPVESFIAPVDFTYDGVEMIKKGTWVMCVHCEDPEVWEGVKRGDYTGFSIGGTGVRRSVAGSTPDGPAGAYMMRQPSDWFTSGGGVAKAKPEDFERWRDHAWEGS